MLDKLNEQQKKAATTLDGYVLIKAGAGSGKTYTLISRVAYMLERGIPAENILLLTFTNKAAKEMTKRINTMVEGVNNDITACTFHSLCSNFLRKNITTLGFPANFNIIDAVDAADAVGIVKEEFIQKQKKAGIEYDLKNFPSAKDILFLHSQSINSCTKFSTIANESVYCGYFYEMDEIVKLYTEYKKARNLADYDDLMLYTIEILNKDENIRKSLDEKYKYIMVDEYQDTNTIQETLLELLTRDNKNLCVVGDAQQSIYAFRSANIENILTFDKRYPTCQTIELFENYRSSQEILDLSNSFMKYCEEGDPINLVGHFNGLKPELVITENVYRENEDIIRKIKQHYANGTKYKKMAVIERSAAQSYILEAELAKHGIPYKKFGGHRFLEKIIVKDVLAFLRVVVNEKDEIALFRLLQLYPGIGTKRAQSIVSTAVKDGLENLESSYWMTKYINSVKEFVEIITKLKSMPLNEQLKFVINGYYPELQTKVINGKSISESKKGEEKQKLDKDLEEVTTLFDLAIPYTSTQDFLDDIVLEASVEDDDEKDYVNITTIHSAKGLEYDVVFIMDVINGKTPRCSSSSDNYAEELRVFYVACTRAKKHLYLMVPEEINTNSYYGAETSKLSSFIDKRNVLDTIDSKASPHKIRKISRSY